MPLMVIGTTFLPDEKLEDITKIIVTKGGRAHIYIGTQSLHMTVDQCFKMMEKLGEKVIPFIEAQREKDLKSLNIEIGDSMKMKDSIGGN